MRVRAIAADVSVVHCPSPVAVRVRGVGPGIGWRLCMVDGGGRRTVTNPCTGHVAVRVLTVCRRVHLISSEVLFLLLLRWKVKLLGRWFVLLIVEPLLLSKSHGGVATRAATTHVANIFHYQTFATSKAAKMPDFVTANARPQTAPVFLRALFMHGGLILSLHCFLWAFD